MKHSRIATAAVALGTALALSTGVASAAGGHVEIGKGGVTAETTGSVVGGKVFNSSVDRTKDGQPVDPNSPEGTVKTSDGIRFNSTSEDKTSAALGNAASIFAIVASLAATVGIYNFLVQQHLIAPLPGLGR